MEIVVLSWYGNLEHPPVLVVRFSIGAPEVCVGFLLLFRSIEEASEVQVTHAVRIRLHILAVEQAKTHLEVRRWLLGDVPFFGKLFPIRRNDLHPQLDNTLTDGT